MFRALHILVLWTFGVFAFSGAALAQQEIKTRAGLHPDHARIVFEWPRKTEFSASITGKELRVVFGEPFTSDYSDVTRRLRGYVGPPKAAAGGKEIRFSLRREVGMQTRQFGNRFVVDLMNSMPASPEKSVAQPLPRPKTGNQESAPQQNMKNGPQVAEVTSERDPAEVQADREKAAALKEERKKKAEAAAAAKALATARFIEDEKQSAVIKEGQISFELRVKEIAGGLRLRFPFPEDASAAVFLRGDHLWVVFDKPAHIDLSIISLLKRDVIQKAEQLDDQDASVLTFQVTPGYVPYAVRRHSVWQVDLLKEVIAPYGILPVIREPEAGAGGLVRVKAGNPAQPVKAFDPVVGDSLVITPVLESAHAVVQQRKYVDFDLLATAQGVAISPNTDRLQVKSQPGSVVISSLSGLLISDDVARNLAGGRTGGVMPQAPAYMDFERWARGSSANYKETQRQLLANVAGSKLAERRASQMALAQFYLAHGLAAESRSTLNIMAAEDANAVKDPYYLGISGVTDYFLARYDGAEKELTDNSLNSDSHAKLWLGAIRARQGLWKDALRAFDSGFAVIGKYPDRIRAEMRVLAGAAALQVAETERAERELNNVPVKNLPPSLVSEAKLLQARLYEARGKTDEALRGYDEVIARRLLPTSVPARLARLLLLNRLGSLDNAKTIEQLEALRYAWRGDDTELKVLEALGERYIANNEYREGLSVMRAAVTYYPNTDRSRRIADQMHEVFTNLFLQDGAKSMPAVKALALYYDFRELTPLGSEGDEMIRRLGERLVAVDLLDEAVELLDHQVKFRLEGTAKAQVAARLAVIELLNKNPDKALDTIRRTQQTRLPEDLTFRRLILEARALMELSEFEQALELIAGYDQGEANLLRADIYWASQDWPMAAISLLKVLESSPSDKPLGAAGQSRVMRAAIAYALAGQQAELDKLQNRYGNAMAASAYAGSFDVITRSASGNGVGFRQLASTIAGIDTLRDFMASYRRDL